MAKKTMSQDPRSRSTPSHPARRLRQVAWWSWGGGPGADEVLKGVLAYNHDHQGWMIHQVWELPADQWPAWDGDGVLMSCNVATIKDMVEQMRIPVVDISADRVIPSLPWVESDNAAIGRMAAEHLLERGLKHFGFCGVDGAHFFSACRRDAFVLRLRQAGFDCSIYTAPAQPSSAPQTEAICRWLEALPKPVGVMGDSPRGRDVLTACHCLRLGVPEDVAIITVRVSNEFVPLEKPPLSSVTINLHRIGYEAAALLDRLMSGVKEPPGTAHLVAPLEVVPRQSTDLLAIPDKYVAMALRQIWQQACTGIHVNDILKVVPQSRRVLERHFRQIVGRTLHEEIVRIKTEKIKTLLTGTDFSLAEIAQRTGFVHATHMSTTFQRETGMTPGKYRTTHTTRHGL